MGRNSHYTLESAWEEISKVKNKYNQQKLIELYQLASPFVTKYQDADVAVLCTPGFACDFLPILRLIVQQSAGKKFLLSYVANPYIGITKSISWIIWLPTRIGSQAAMSILKNYIVDLEIQARGQNQVHVATQTDDINRHQLLVPSNTVEVVDEPVDIDETADENEPVLVPKSDVNVLVPNLIKPDLVPKDQNNDQNNDSAMTSGIGCGGDTEWSSSDGEINDIMANCINNSKVADDTPSQPQLNSTMPASTTAATTPVTTPRTGNRRSEGPRRLTKGSRRNSLRDSGINLASAGSWEDSRRAVQTNDDAEKCILQQSMDEIKEIDMTDLEISQFENGEAFENIEADENDDNSSDSFVEIPDLE